LIFDNITVQQGTGPLSEETHYYPFGLTKAGIIDNAVGKLENKFKFLDRKNKVTSSAMEVGWKSMTLGQDFTTHK